MIITILCSDPTHPVNDYIRSWIEEYSSPEKQIELVRRKDQAKGGDLLFSDLVQRNDSCGYYRPLSCVSGLACQ